MSQFSTFTWELARFPQGLGSAPSVEVCDFFLTVCSSQFKDTTPESVRVGFSAVEVILVDHSSLFYMQMFLD